MPLILKIELWRGEDRTANILKPRFENSVSDLYCINSFNKLH